MSLKPPPSSNVIPPKEAKEDRVVISFAFEKYAGKYHAIAIKTQGHQVIDTKIIEADDFKMVPERALDKVSMDYWREGIDPFAPPNLKRDS